MDSIAGMGLFAHTDNTVPGCVDVGGFLTTFSASAWEGTSSAFN